MIRSLALTALLSLILSSPNLAVAGEIPYDGLKKCKGCHKSQYKSWRQTAHAKAFESLEAGAKEEAKAKAGLDPEQDYTEDKDCVACHVTGFGEEGGYEIDDPSKYTVDVGCETCHGPGSEYRRLHRKAADKFEKSKETTPRQVLADAGEEYEFIERCKSCHMNYEGSPWPGAAEPYTPFTPEVDPKYGFDFDKHVRDEKAMHEHFKLEGMFTGPPLPPFHQEFQDTAKPVGKD
jgi:hypothetical protein